MIQFDVGYEFSRMTNRIYCCKLCREKNRFSTEGDTTAPKLILKMRSYQIIN